MTLNRLLVRSSRSQRDGHGNLVNAIAHAKLKGFERKLTRSANRHLLTYFTYANNERAFRVAAPRLWNELPPDIRKSTLATFKKHLKTFLFCKHYGLVLKQ